MRFPHGSLTVSPSSSGSEAPPGVGSGGLKFNTTAHATVLVDD